MQTVLITGASSGIGAATALQFAENNYHVILCGRNLERLQKIKNRIPKSSVLRMDLSQPDQIAKAYVEVQSLLKSNSLELKCLVNNAGIFARTDNFSFEASIWHEQFATNFWGPVQLTSALLALLKQSAPANIVNVASTLGVRSSATTSAYSAAKAALINWTESLALECAAHKIRVNAVSPGIVETPIHEKTLQEGGEVLRQKFNSLQPLGRMGQPEDIARAIYFLGSDNSSWTTGTNFIVDGGINISNN